MKSLVRVWAFLVAARKALASGGVLIAETINTDSLSALKAFFLDPTHVRPVPPDALKFLAEAAGFADARIEYKAPLPEGERLAEVSPNDARLNRLLSPAEAHALAVTLKQEAIKSREEHEHCEIPREQCDHQTEKT